ncbi:MAG: zinc-binding alcohol dehydrogenase [Chloroflexota bacterium]
MQAKAVVFTAPNQVEVQSITCPEPESTDAVIRLTHSWISNGTEGSFLRGERIHGDTAYREGDPWPFPIIAGYQKIGVVEWVGEEITDLSVGETVFAVSGKVNGMYALTGGQVSPSVSPHGHIWKLPSGVDPLAFSGMVLTQVGYNCGVRAPVEIGDVAVVVGDGMVGQWAAQTLAWRGAEVYLIGRHDYRLALFAGQSGRHVINEKLQPDWAAVIQERCPGGVKVAVDTVGSLDAMTAFMPTMQRNGHLISAGFYGTEDAFPLQPPRYGELSIHLVSGWTRKRMDETLRLIAAGYLDTLPLITHHFPVDQAADAWQLIESKSEPVLGVILDWTEG